MLGYEPLLRGSRTRAIGFEQPVRGVPDDLLTVDLSAVFPELKDKRVRGRLEGNKVVPYWSRAEIAAQAAAGARPRRSLAPGRSFHRRPAGPARPGDAGAVLFLGPAPVGTVRAALERQQQIKSFDGFNVAPTGAQLTEAVLSSYIAKRRNDALDAIEDMLDEALLVPSTRVRPDVVTMYSTVELHDPCADQRTTLTVCYPSDAEPDKGFVSALSPLGWSLLGLHVGDTTRWVTPAGEPREARIVAILFQPEATGDYVT